jgi:ABC-type nitrate/sulfonate/bicarbonate transport system ATPase subunit
MSSAAPTTGKGATDTFRSLSFEGLRHAYGEGEDAVQAVRDLDLHLEAGEFVTVLGPSGCGKSTLFNLASGLAESTPGQVLIHGESLTGINPHTAYMYQHDALLDWRTVLDNVALGREFLGMSRKEARAELRESLGDFGLEGFADRHPAELSGGMRQRVALMRTYATERPLLLLDEPFGALDAMTRVKMQEFLLKKWDEDHRTVLFITHDVDEALILGDRVVVLSHRPATVREELVVDLPRPRRADQLASDPRYVELRAHIMTLLHDPAEPGVVA